MGFSRHLRNQRDCVGHLRGDGVAEESASGGASPRLASPLHLRRLHGIHATNAPCRNGSAHGSGEHDREHRCGPESRVTDRVAFVTFYLDGVKAFETQPLAEGWNSKSHPFTSGVPANANRNRPVTRPKELAAATPPFRSAEHDVHRSSRGPCVPANYNVVYESTAAYLGEFEQLVCLAILQLGPKATGAAIRAAVADGGRRRVWIGAVYTTLDRLETKGLIRSGVARGTAAGVRRRKVYALAPAGRSAVGHAHETWLRMTRGLSLKLEAD